MVTANDQGADRIPVTHASALYAHRTETRAHRDSVQRTAMPFRSSIEVNSVPVTKLSNGPNVRAAVAPMKCNPGSELSIPARRTGYPSNTRTRCSNFDERNANRE